MGLSSDPATSSLSARPKVTSDHEQLRAGTIGSRSHWEMDRYRPAKLGEEQICVMPCLKVDLQ